MKFVDLFTGLGGFHLALRRLGHICVFASEIDRDLRALYEQNFGLAPEGDIRKVRVADIPSHDILSAGFPCQPFSKAGDQKGFAHPRWGDLFDYTLNIIKARKPTYIMLENVPNLERHDNGTTWNKIRSELVQAGYEVSHKRLSPHRFGIPQIRERMFIVGSLAGLEGFSWPQEACDTSVSIRTILDSNPVNARPISQRTLDCLDTWQDFLNRFPKDRELPSFPIWSMEFGATYPFEEQTPYLLGLESLAYYRGTHGRPLSDLPANERIQALPSYARSKENKFPRWKVQFIRQNRQLYQENKAWIHKWLPNILQFPASQQKFEWNCKGEERWLWNYLIQFRASGVRVKRPTTSPSLIAMNTTQVPIIAWERRYITPQECLRLQSMGELQFLPERQSKVFKALGNAVNVDIVELIASSLLSSGDPAVDSKAGVALQEIARS